jgi:hypothetical protein
MPRKPTFPEEASTKPADPRPPGVVGEPGEPGVPAPLNSQPVPKAAPKSPTPVKASEAPTLPPPPTGTRRRPGSGKMSGMRERKVKLRAARVDEVVADLRRDPRAESDDEGEGESGG